MSHEKFIIQFVALQKNKNISNKNILIEIKHIIVLWLFNVNSNLVRSVRLNVVLTFNINITIDRLRFLLFD
jgi:hypothetical protein